MAGKTILVVDDDESLVQAMSLRLRAAGYEVLVAMDGMQAVMMTHRHTPDLIVMDIRMPAGSGLTVMDKLHQSTRTMTIPVIVITAFDDEETKEKANQLGALRYFKKPFDTDEFIKAVAEALPDPGA